MIIKEFNFRSDILSYNLGGMGCSAGSYPLILPNDCCKVQIPTTVPRPSLFRRRILLKTGTVGMRNPCSYQTACFGKDVLQFCSPTARKTQSWNWYTLYERTVGNARKHTNAFTSAKMLMEIKACDCPAKSCELQAKH